MSSFHELIYDEDDFKMTGLVSHCSNTTRLPEFMCLYELSLLSILRRRINGRDELNKKENG